MQVRGETHYGIALLDTGFEGDVIVPAHLSVGFPGRIQDLILADGSPADAPVLGGYVRLADLEYVPADVMFLGEDFIVGTGILSRYEVILDHGRRVIVNP